MAHDLQLIAFLGLMAAQAFAAASSYLYSRRPSERAQAERPSVGATPVLVGVSK